MIHCISAEVIGAAFYAIPVDSAVSLEFKTDTINILISEKLSKIIHFSEIIDLNIYGPGKATSGGGFIGGGTGIEGAIIGIAASAFLNAATTKLNIQTFISIVTMTGELHFLCRSHEPFVLRIGLARVFSVMRHLDTNKIDEQMARLDKINKLGMLSDADLVKIKKNFSDKKNFMPISGYLISSVSNGGVAQKAGLQAGDLLVQYNGVEIRSDNDLANAIKNVTSRINIFVVRQGTFISLGCDLGRLGIDGQIVGV